MAVKDLIIQCGRHRRFLDAKDLALSIERTNYLLQVAHIMQGTHLKTRCVSMQAVPQIGMVVPHTTEHSC